MRVSIVIPILNEAEQSRRSWILVFLHADVRLRPDSVHALRIAMQDERIVAPRFDLVYEIRRWPYPLIAWLGTTRSRMTGW
jgi:hypothetical protein